jgi:hypothetical protein
MDIKHTMIAVTIAIALFPATSLGASEPSPIFRFDELHPGAVALFGRLSPKFISVDGYLWYGGVALEHDRLVGLGGSPEILDAYDGIVPMFYDPITGNTSGTLNAMIGLTPGVDLLKARVVRVADDAVIFKGDDGRYYAIPEPGRDWSDGDRVTAAVIRVGVYRQRRKSGDVKRTMPVIERVPVRHGISSRELARYYWDNGIRHLPTFTARRIVDQRATTFVKTIPGGRGMFETRRKVSAGSVPEIHHWEWFKRMVRVPYFTPPQ